MVLTVLKNFVDSLKNMKKNKDNKYKQIKCESNRKIQQAKHLCCSLTLNFVIILVALKSLAFYFTVPTLVSRRADYDNSF